MQMCTDKHCFDKKVALQAEPTGRGMCLVYLTVGGTQGDVIVPSWELGVRGLKEWVRGARKKSCS